jgi:iron complex outermembrane receptor protein
MGTKVPGFLFSFRTAASTAMAAVTLGLLPWGLATAADNNNNNNATPTTTDNSGTKHEAELNEVVVTGSLIPTTDVSIQTPVTVISNEDIQAKGFTDIAEALQRSAFATGSVINAQATNSFTPAAKVVSLFGLDVSFTKYLIDGRPIANYPSLYNGAENFVSLNGIPTVLVDHLDVLTGGQSSVYGSDAIAGVVNVIMKKNLDGPVVDIRGGWTADGGGEDERYAIGDGFTFGNLNVVVGGQYENTSPVYGFQRPLTSEYNQHGATPPQAELDYLVYGLYGNPGGTGVNGVPNGSIAYFEDPNNCANVKGLFHNSEGFRQSNLGPVCGSLAEGFFTLNNADETTEGFLNATYDVTDTLQLFLQTLVNHEVTLSNNGQHFFGSGAAGGLGFYEDPRITTPLNPLSTATANAPDLLNLQAVYSPEEAGSLNQTNSKYTNNGWRQTIGAKGDFLASWHYLADFTWTQNKLTERVNSLITAPLEAYYSNIYGPLLGVDANTGANIYEPNYANFYKPVSVATYQSFDGSFPNYSETEESFARAVVNTTDLFPLPGGNAGLAVQLEGGDQGWRYVPDAAYFNGTAFGITATAGAGHRSRYAGTTELQLPVLSMLSFTLSGRYDDYRVSGANVDKFTYNLGFQFKPIEQFIFRGRYGTSFKAPTLADEFQGQSGNFQSVTDYYLCAKEGFTGANLGNCPNFSVSTFVQTQGNPALKPITANDWDLGFIVYPVDRLSLTVDFIHFAINNEVGTAQTSTLLATESACLLGQLNVNSPTCQAAIADVTRNDNGTGAIVSILEPKANIAEENLGVLSMQLDYKFYAGWVGQFDIDGQYQDTMSHNLQQFPGDPIINLLDSPFFSEEFKTKDNLTVTWVRDQLSATLYVERYGKTPNYIAYTSTTTLPGAGNVNAWTLANASISYRPLQMLSFTFAINNLFNTGPPADTSQPGFSGQPYLITNYNDYGRTYFITANYHGGTK